MLDHKTGPDPDDLTLLEGAVRAAGEIALDFYGKDYRIWNKEGGSPVTEADLAVNRHLQDVLTAARPAYGWLSEESRDDPARLTRARVFVIDPIDGTVAFLKGRPHFTICAAVVEQTRPLCGAVYNPVTGQLYAARKDGGATCNGAPIHVGAREILEGCAMLGRRDVLAHAPWPAMDVQNRSSLALRLALVAAGDADAAVSLTAKRDWDLAAADIILTEAGGRVSDVDGQALRYNGPAAVQPGLVAASPALHTAILTLLRQ